MEESSCASPRRLPIPGWLLLSLLCFSTGHWTQGTTQTLHSGVATSLDSLNFRLQLCTLCIELNCR